MGIDYLENGLPNDIEIIEAAFYNSFEIVSKNQSQEKQIILQLLCYALISYICSFIEKLLREIFIKENQEQMFIDVNSLTLGDLLNIKINLNALRVLRNKVGHHNFLFAETYANCVINEAESNSLEQNIKNLQCFLPRDFRERFAIALNKCANGLDVNQIIEI